MFRASDQFDLQIQVLGANDPNSVAQRQALEAERDNAIKLVLGAARYGLYQSLHDADYREAYAAAQQAGQPETASVLYEINQAAADEQARIRANTNLTAEQRAIESKRAELAQLEAAAQALGQTCRRNQLRLPNRRRPESMCSRPAKTRDSSPSFTAWMPASFARSTRI